VAFARVSEMTTEMDRFFVLTGGPGSGKTTLIEALRARGFATTDEAGRGVIREEVERGGDALPWLDRERFAERMFAWELRSWRDAERAAGPVFFDRGLPDTTGYLRLEGLEVPAWMEEEAWRLRYNTSVFIAPPWPEIYGRDEERRQNWDIALRTYEVMAETYRDFGYTLLELPKADVQARADFVIAATGGT
jgi:predicted ATPase